MKPLLPVATTLLLLLPLTVRADCPQVERAFFTSEVRDREPVDELILNTGQMQAVLFFVELHDGAGETLQVAWSSDGIPESTVNLSIGGDRWRTWSSRNISTAPEQGWQVRLSTRSGCQLGDYQLPAEPAESKPPIPEALLDALQAGDLPAARGHLEEAKSSFGDDSRLARIESVDMPLLQLGNDIERDRLYTAAARLEQLEYQLSADDPARARLAALSQRWQQRNRTLNAAMIQQLAALEASLKTGLLGLQRCPEDDQQAAKYWQQINPDLPLLLTGYSHNNGPQLILLDNRTGLTHGLTIHCQSSSAMDR